jgi:hypothetical protein
MSEQRLSSNAVDGSLTAQGDERASWDFRYREFQRHRARLFGIAYRMLGSRSNAEDILQEVYLHWHCTVIDTVRSPEAWLVTSVTRLCIDRLRAARAEREMYVGPWLPQPLLPDAASGVEAELAANLSIAFLVLLERLAPHELGRTPETTSLPESDLAPERSSGRCSARQDRCLGRRSTAPDGR